MTLDINIDIQRKPFSGHFEASFPANGAVAIYGRSGSGKTSLLRAICGQIHSTGSINLYGRSLQKLKPQKRKVAAVFQNTVLFPHMSVEKNLQFAIKRAHNNYEINYFDVLGKCDLDNLLKLKPQMLSSGERQRVLVARALLSKPDILLLDEALNNIDLQRKTLIMQLINSIIMENKIPLLYVCHDIHEIAQIARYMALVSDGCFEEIGLLENISTNPALSFAQGSDASTFLHCKLSKENRFEEAASFNLCALEYSGGKIFVAGAYKILKENPNIVVEVKARDVSLALSLATDSSIVNIIPCHVDSIHVEASQAHALIRLKSGDDYILSRITRYSLSRLDLTPGQAIFAQIKSVALPQL